MKQHTYTPDSRGLVSKYVVYRRNADGSQGELVEGPTFTLRPYDPHARVALVAYAESVANENPQLAEDVFTLVAEHSEGDEE